MSKASDIITALIDQLKASEDVQAIGVQAYFVGMRERIASFPCIILDVVSVTETDTDGMNIIDQDLQLVLIAYKKVQNADAQIGEMFDFTNAIKKCIDADPTIGGRVITTTTPEEHHDFTSFPVRGFALSIMVKNRQARAVRA